MRSRKIYPDRVMETDGFDSFNEFWPFYLSEHRNPVARLLASQPAGIHPDSVQGSGYLIPSLISGCENFVELTGRAGDIPRRRILRSIPW